MIKKFEQLERGDMAVKPAVIVLDLSVKAASVTFPKEILSALSLLTKARGGIRGQFKKRSHKATKVSPSHSMPFFHSFVKSFLSFSRSNLLVRPRGNQKDWSYLFLNSRGVQPFIFRNAALNRPIELKPLSKAISVILVSVVRSFLCA
jgi:hypothetical protein